MSKFKKGDIVKVVNHASCHPSDDFSANFYIGEEVRVVRMSAEEVEWNGIICEQYDCVSVNNESNKWHLLDINMRSTRADSEYF